MKRSVKHIVADIEKYSLREGVGFSVFILFSLLLIAGTQFILEKQLLSKEVHRGDAFATQLKDTTKSYLDLKNQDQYKINQSLHEEIAHIHTSYGDSITSYQKMLDLQAQKVDTGDMDKAYVSIVNNLSNQNYATADAQIADLNGQIKTANDKLQAALIAAGAPAGSATAPVSNTAPGSGFRQQKVQTDAGTFTVDIIAADLGSTRVIVDTASDGDCSNNCPTLPLNAYVARSGAYAGINGNFFCPAEYPSCAGKTGSFDLLVMNKNKHYFNSANNVYSTNPAFIFSGSVRSVSAAEQWGRDTSVDAVISNFPLLVSGGNTVYSDSPDPKFNSVGTRGFVAHKGNTVFIGFVFGATMGQSAKVMKAMGMDDAMNLDEGGSTALWYGTYVAGPGRNIPDALLFVRR